jgi:hypothetical protein
VHANKPFSVDFTELWTGAPDVKKGLSSKWKGGFRGRPALADVLWPVLNDVLLHKQRGVLSTTRSVVCAFFRFLDSYEQRFSRVDTLSDIRTEFSLLWRTPVENAWEQSTRVAHNCVGRLLRRARRMQFGHDDVWDWHVFSREPSAIKELPSEDEVRSALTLLKQTAYGIYARWDRADRLAAQGRNLLDWPLGPNRRMPRAFEATEADLHATYRAFIARTGNSLPSLSDFVVALGGSPMDPSNRNYPYWWRRLRCSGGDPSAGQALAWDDLQAGLYPTLDDIDCLSQLFMARAGWNPGTVLALDISNPTWARPHGDPASKVWVIESWKERSRDWQFTMSMGKHTTGPYYIVSRLLERTAALRTLVKQNASVCDSPTVALRSPWLCAGTSWAAGRVLLRDQRSTVRSSKAWRKLVLRHNAEVEQHNALIRRENATLPAASQRRLWTTIPVTMVPSDWRDIFASHVFQDSRYSWVLVQWALGHKHMATTRLYLRKTLWRRYSERKLTDLQHILIDELSAHARVDAVVLRARAEFGVTPNVQDRARLDLHRKRMQERELTYTGYRCTDPLRPPPEIDPANPGDGSQPCSRGDRCPGCPIAQAVDAHHMVKRMVELRWLRRHVSATIWIESQYASDLLGLEADLTQWPSDEVAQTIAYWEREIEAGRHRVVRFGGRS